MPGYATLAWVHANAAELEVDAGRIALIGDSALAAEAMLEERMAAIRGFLGTA